MGTERVEEVVIVGAGVCGLATAVALKRVGIQAVVLEGWDRLRGTGAALTLFQNAWLALDALGVAHKLTPLYAPFNKSIITNVRDGATQEVSFAGAESGGNGPRSVHRKALLEALAEELPIETIHFSSKLTSISTQEIEGSPIVILQMEDGTIIKTKILIGCDGVHSVVAHWLGLAKPVNSGRFAVRGLAVYPEGHGFNHEVRQFLQVGLRGAFVPLNDKELYWFLVTSKSTTKDHQNMATRTPELIQKEIIEHYAKDFPPIYLDVARHVDLSMLTCAPLMLRLPWDVIFGNISKGTVVVAGDAMHPMTPDLGQGGCLALEDAVVLGRHIGESFIENGRLVPQEAAKAIEKYVKERKWRAAGLITGSYLSGWAQQDGSFWWRKFFRDVIFYKFIFQRLGNVTKYDCGKLPKLS